MSNLSDFFNRVGSTKGFNPVDSFVTRKQSLPNGGGVYNSPVPSPQTSVPAPQISAMIFPKSQNTTPPASPIFSQGAAAPVRSKYYSPELGRDYTPKEYADMLASKIPVSNNKGDGDIGQTAGDALLYPNQSSSTLDSTARGLNNARNDIATGTTDPYGVGRKSGIDYSPEQLSAIEKAYAGIYDPAIEDVFTRLKQRQADDKAEQDRLDKIAEAAQKREDQIFATNENIRQWRATTGSKSTGSDSEDTFTRTQLNSGASNSGLSIAAFDALDQDLKNFYINTPTELNPVTNKMEPMYASFENLIKGVESGKVSSEDAADEIESSTLPDTVKHYFIDRIPQLSQPKKESYFSKIWGAITGK